MRLLKHYPEEFPEAWASAWGEDALGLWMAFTYKGVGQVFRWIEPGTFMMGSPVDEPERYLDEILHTVILSRGFWLAETTVTQALWIAVMTENPSRFKGDNRPVENITWDRAQAFIEKMNGILPALRLRLPTEMEWEYACRAGAETQTPFSFGPQIDSSLVNFNGAVPYNQGKPSVYRRKTVEVKTLPANAWGMYEMHGNVWEWCRDWYGEYPAEPAIDPTGPATGVNRVLRGGSWFSDGRRCRSANRAPRLSGDARGNAGFRLARGH